MDKDDVLNVVKRFSDTVRSVIDPLMVVLYGSCAKGSPTASSDIDVAVVVDRIKGDFLEGILRTGEFVYRR
jgi:predicted nucleotidyltransferase